MKKLYLIIASIFICCSLQAQTLNGIIPNTGTVGQQNLNTTITATNLFQVVGSPQGNIYEAILRQGANVIPIYDYQMFGWPPSVNVLDPDNATAVFSIPGTAVTGLYDLELTTTDPFFPGSNLQLYTATGAFTVSPPDGYISGKVYLDQNENGIYDVGESPLANQSLTIQPSNINIQTDANGDYNLGVSNGNYTVTWISNFSHKYLLSSDSAAFNITVNSSNVSGLDFGLVDGLTSLAPSVAFQGDVLNANVTSRLLFLSGANPWGNISSGYIRLTTSPFSQYNITTSSFQHIDSSNAQLLFNIPLAAPTGVYDLVIRINNFSYFLPGALTITLPPSYLTGHCFFDANNNGLFDLGESPVGGATMFLTPELSYAVSNSSGDYQFGARLGSHVLSFNSQPTSYMTLTTQPSYSFTNTGNQGGFDFGFRSSLPDYNCAISFNPGFMRCFQTVTSTIVYTNTSNVVCQGKVYLAHSSNTVFSSSVPVSSSTSGDTIFWDFSNLQPFESRQITVAFTNPGAGSTVSFKSGIQVVDGSSVVQFEDTSTTPFSIRCAYDPNDKAVFPEGVDDVMHYTLMTDPLEYLIRFQNTGNDTAFTVYIRDTIDVSLDLASLEVLASSHSVQTEVDSNRAVVFMFANIMLADSVVDEPHSHGFVRYRIQPNAILIDPTVVENTAYIYFDFNPAVVTNTTWNTLVQVIPVGISESIQVDEGVFFYPNPMDEKGYFSFENTRSERMLMELFDVKGQRVSVLESNGSFMELNRKQLASGLYMFRLINTQSGKVNSGKISIR
ncbi:MAG: T9SS type A sorting domain-containing protein [Bacteroidetes bacterium]|nr:MAG: T9SS type A sorting domain-containing protein [Bacteroidota bacterium]